MPSHRSLCYRCPGFLELLPESLEAYSRSPSSYRSDRSFPTMTQTWVSRPQHPLGSHLSPPGSLRDSPIPEVLFRRRRQVQACTGEGAVPREGPGGPLAVGMARYCQRNVTSILLKIHLSPTGNINCPVTICRSVGSAKKSASYSSCLPL